MTAVNVDNFRRAETARMFDNTLALSGGVNRWFHSRVPTPVEQQPVIRMNRDTLYSGVIVDISDGATLRLPDADGRYLSAMVVNEEHYTQVFSEPGEYDLDPVVHGSEFVSVAIRTFVDSSDPADIAQVNQLQDEIELVARSARCQKLFGICVLLERKIDGYRVVGWHSLD